MLKFAIIGAGAGGQSMAAILTSKGYIAKLYDIDKEKIHRLQELKTIKVTGVIACEAAPAVITDRIDEVMDDVDVIMVVSTTDAHRSIAYACKPYLKDGQIVMLNPGHCGGALEIANILRALEAKGWVEREHSKTDRRRVHVTVTDKGFQVIEIKRREFEDRTAAFLEQLGETDTQEMVRLLRRANEIIDRNQERRDAK